MGSATTLRQHQWTEAAAKNGSPAHECSEEDLDRVVAQITRLTRTATLEFSLRIGAIIIHHCYAGDTELWRRRGPKTTSFRQLAAHPSMPMSPVALYRCVAIFELCERLNVASRWRNLGASHLRAVLGFESSTQERLLSRANSEQLSVRALQEEVDKIRSTRANRGGRRPVAPALRIVKTIRNCLVQHDQAIRSVQAMEAPEVRELVLLLEDARTLLQAIAECLQAPIEEAKPAVPFAAI
jgi:hypothetical protein